MNKHKSQKQLQVAEQIKRILADIFLQDNHFQLPQIHITITQADISPDMKNAKIFVNIFGKINSGGQAKLTEELNLFSVYLRTKLANKVSTSSVPKLKFILDGTSDNAAKISNLINQESKK